LRVFIHIDYENEDGKEVHARMMGIITNVFNPPPVGAYAVYADEAAPAVLPKQPPLPGTTGSVLEKSTRSEVLAKLGGLHGQRVGVEIALVPDEVAEHPRLAGVWKVRAN
jgi:hypothetical protein